MKKKTKEGKHDKKVTDDEKDNYNTAGTVKNLRPVRQKSLSTHGIPVR